MYFLYRYVFDSGKMRLCGEIGFLNVRQRTEMVFVRINVFLVKNGTMFIENRPVTVF